MTEIIASPRVYQRKGVNTMLKKFDGKALCADDMGLGKTLQSIIMIERLRVKTLVVCPSSLKYNWADEIKKFWPNKKFWVCSGRTPLAQRDLKKYDLFICNYEILQYWRDTFISLGIKFLICDESHYVKTRTSLRFKAAYAISKTCDYRICLTGTPIENQPAELWAQMQIVNRKLFPSWILFIKRYNGARRNRWGWELKKATNTKELNKILLDNCMIRRRKTEVLAELPDKSRQVIPLQIKTQKDYDSAEQDILTWLKKNTELNLEKTKKALFLTKMEKLKLIAGLGKVDEVCTWVNEESPNRKLVVFCHHHEVLESLRKKIKNCIVMDSSTKGEERQRIANLFQSDPNIRVFLSTIRVGGTGLNLFAAATTVFIQLDWNPMKHEQAEDRVLRIGQTAKEVNALYFIGRDTIEEKIIKLLDLKRQNSKSIIDGEDVLESEMLTELMKEMTNKLTIE